MKKTTKKIIGWVCYLAVLVGLVVGTPRLLSFALKTPYPMASITSSSMWPALKRGDLVFIKGVGSRGNIEVGDVIVYNNSLGFTIHRVVELNQETLITKGDANNTPDAPVKYGEVIGRAVKWGEEPFRIPWLGHISILLNKNLNAKNVF